MVTVLPVPVCVNFIHYFLYAVPAKPRGARQNSAAVDQAICHVILHTRLHQSIKILAYLNSVHLHTLWTEANIKFNYSDAQWWT